MTKQNESLGLKTFKVLFFVNNALGQEKHVPNII